MQIAIVISLGLLARLRDVGTARLEHAVRGGCPNEVRDPSSRDGSCPACKVLAEADAALARAESTAGDAPCPLAVLARRGMLTAPEIAELVGSSLKTIHNHAAAGHLVGSPIAEGQHRRFSATAARDYIRPRVSHVPAWLEALAAGEAAPS